MPIDRINKDKPVDSINLFFNSSSLMLKEDFTSLSTAFFAGSSRYCSHKALILPGMPCEIR